jgi:hypothetical protein
VYKIFDEKYAEIFGRQEVNAARIIHVTKIMSAIEDRLESITLKPLAYYALTKYFLASVLSTILRGDKKADEIMRNPFKMPLGREEEFYKRCGAIIGSLIIDLNYEVQSKGASFDYKADLKSPKQIEELSNILLKSYEKDVARGKADGFANW